MKTDNFLIEFEPTLHCIGNFWTPASTNFSYGKKQNRSIFQHNMLYSEN